MKLPEIIGICGVACDFDSWNSLQERYNSKNYNPKDAPPKHFLEDIYKEFLTYCENYHIDNSKFKYCELSQIEGGWQQVDFLDSKTDKYPARVMIHSIVYSEEKRKVYQSAVDLG